MNQLLKIKDKLQLEASPSACEVQIFLGGGGQGEVYRADLNGKAVALKWYFPHQATVEQKTALETLIRKGAPNNNFLWPINLITAQSKPGFGYIMPLREGRYKSIVDLMKGRVSPSFQALAAAGVELADSFLQLHGKGLCYRDISFGNVFFDPDSGKILICDNDNVGADGNAPGGVLGTPRFMAPEIVRGQAVPSTQTDLYSLAVLLFYMFMVHHPLECKRESEIKCFDAPAMNQLYGFAPLFIYDPHDSSNRPVQGYHDNAILYWRIYPQFIRDIFTKAFTAGIDDPLSRVRESEWRVTLARLRDSVIYCGACGAENFYDLDGLKNNGKLNPCWDCNKPVQAPARIRIDKQIIMLNHDSKLYPHHIYPQQNYDYTQPAGEMTRHPQNPNHWGIKNLSSEKWVITTPDGQIKDVQPGQSVPIAVGTKINFGKTEGEIRI